MKTEDGEHGLKNWNAQETRRIVMRVWREVSEAHGSLEKAILSMPSGDIRNQLTDANILLMDAIQKLRDL